MEIARTILWLVDAVVVVYYLLYLSINFTLLALSSRLVTRSVQLSHLLRRRSEEQPTKERTFLPLVSLIVPAYDEEVTIVDNVNSLLNLEYPHYEIIVVNDGSKDGTLDAVKDAFQMRRGEVDYDPHLGTMPIRGFSRAGIELPGQVVRLVLVDKENGGKADAINAGINASQGTYVATMDADSLLVDRALQVTMQPIVDDPNRVVACGGQVAVSNDCVVDRTHGRVLQVNLPRRWIARFQAVEYMRSFTQSRTALGSLNAVLILSGVFAVFQREALIAAGGFLTKHMRARVGREYCGESAETVCEDMEVVVRLHRYLTDHGQPVQVDCLPFPTAWTEVPEVWTNLGKQRNRWHRGLLEVLWFHRKMMFRRKYGRIGLFALPYQLFFEALAPLLELLGYILVPASWAMGLLSGYAALSFMAFAMAANLALSVGSVLVAIWRTRAGPGGGDLALLDYRGARPLLLLTLAALLSNFGYRQYLLWWQLRGIKDFLAGRKSWDKFARRGLGDAA